MPPRRQHGAMPLSERHTCPPPTVLWAAGVKAPRRRPSICATSRLPNPAVSWGQWRVMYGTTGWTRGVWKLGGVA